MTSILVVKTGALGDVLRTTSILPGLHARHRSLQTCWVTAPGAVDLVRLHPLVTEVAPVEVALPASVERASRELGARRWDWVISLDDEEPLCRLAAGLPCERLSGAYLDERGERRYTDDVAPWFDMGLLSRHGKAAADRLKVENRRSHPEIFAGMLGIEPGEAELPLPTTAVERAQAFAREHGLAGRDVPLIGLNTGAGGRWTSKALPVERTVGLAREVHRRLDGRAAFALFGGPSEEPRNVELLRGLRGEGLDVVDAGCRNALLDFAALVGLCDVLVTSDSLALHLALARRTRLVAFFAPTSAAEIDLHGRGEKVASTAPDACSYRPDADTSTLTVERLADAVLRQVAARGARATPA